MKSKNENRILIIQTAYLGDVIMSSPLIKAHYQTFPHVKIDVLINKNSKEIIKNTPYISEIIELNKRNLFKKIFSAIKILPKIRKKKYKYAISLQHSFTSSWLMILGGIKERIGLRKLKFATKNIILEKNLHVRDRYLKIMSIFSDKIFNNQTEIFWSDNDEKRAQKIYDSILRKDEKCIGIAPGSVRFTKMWPWEYFSKLIKNLNNLNFKIILLGSPNEKALCEKIILNSKIKAHNYAGTLSITESAALINKMDLMLTNDSAPLHIANAVQTDVFSFFGPTVKKFGCYPYREKDKIFEVHLNCRPCGKHGGEKCPLGHFKCMKMIKPEMVIKKIKEYFNLKEGKIQ